VKLKFEIIRLVNGVARVMDASEATEVQPGDTIRVRMADAVQETGMAPLLKPVVKAHTQEN
jgi:hypothetical protein